MRLIGFHHSIIAPTPLHERQAFVLPPTPTTLSRLNTGGVSWAPLGLVSMLNGGGAVLFSSLSPRFRVVRASVTLRATDRFLSYCRPRPRGVEVMQVRTRHIRFVPRPELSFG